MKSLVVRLRKRGLPTDLCYDIVLVHPSKRAKGGYIEKLGYCNKLQVAVNFERLGFWLNRGAFIRKSVKKCLYPYGAVI